MNLLTFCQDLYTIPRSLTGKGVELSLQYIQKYLPLTIKKIPSGTKVFDWEIPSEWNIHSAYIIDLNTNEKIIDIKNHNLHVVGYSQAINKILNYDQLIEHLFYIKEQPQAIPYITSYYKRRWGFCLTYNQFKKLNKSSKYQVFIDSQFNDKGHLTYGELLIKGKVKEELLLSSYICHPQMVNNELSGPAVLTAIAKHLLNQPNYYSYRFVLIPETIGSITYLSQHLDHLKQHTIGGFNITCVGDQKAWGYIPSRKGDTRSDLIAQHVLTNFVDSYKHYSWLDRGSDERQYCAPGIDLPIASITRSKYGEYPEYHTSLDNFDLVTQKGLEESLSIYLKCLKIFELGKNIKPKINVLGEPQLGKRGLYPTISTKESGKTIRNMMNFISFCDGSNTILEIANNCKINFFEAYDYFIKLKEKDLFY